MIALVLAVTLFVAPAAAPGKAQEGPVAVMPFKNLNTDTKLGWLEKGIAETMISDLKKGSKVAVVEREQVDKAVRELALQTGKDTDDSTAAKIGKLVGARTIVLGSFQQSGKELRINARFVSVETGVVLDAAKATGPAANVFALQDEIVARLLGQPAGTKVAVRAVRKPSPKMFDAYRLYAMSLDTATDADRAAYLKQSIAIDPEFVYALDDLAALEKRMASLVRISQVKLLEQEQQTLTTIFDDKTAGDERTRLAKTLLDQVHTARRYHALLSIGGRIYDAKGLPNFMGVDPREYSSFYRVMAAYRLNQWDLALQYGEKHMQEFPAGMTFRGAEGLLKEIIQKRRTWAKRRAEYDQDVREKLDDAKGPEHAVDRDYAPCIAARWTSQENDLMLDGCGGFLKKHGTATDPETRKKSEAARCFVVFALAQRGEWDAARAQATKILADSDECDTELEGRMMMWPAD